MSSRRKVLRIQALLQRKTLLKTKNRILKCSKRHYSTAQSMKNVAVSTEDGAPTPPLGICHPRQKKSNARGSARGRGGGGADGIDRCIIIPPRKYEAVIHCSVLWFTTGRIPADAKGATVAKLDEPVDRNKIENRSQNKILGFFCGGITNLLFDGLAYNNILLTDRNLFYATRKISARIIC